MSPYSQEIVTSMVRIGIPVVTAIQMSRPEFIRRATKKEPGLGGFLFFGLFGFFVGNILQSALFYGIERLQMKGLPRVVTSLKAVK